MFPYLQFDTDDPHPLFMLSYEDDLHIYLLYCNEAGAYLTELPDCISTGENIASLLKNQLKGYLRQSIDEKDGICFRMPVNLQAKDTPTWMIRVHTSKFHGSLIITGEAFLTNNPICTSIGILPVNVFEELTVRNPNFILFGIAQNQQEELKLIYKGPFLFRLKDHESTCEQHDALLIKDYLNESNYLIVKSHFMECLNSKKSQSFIVLHNSNGEHEYFNIHMYYVCNHNAEYVYGTASDVTQTFIRQHKNVCVLHKSIYHIFEVTEQPICLVHIDNGMKISIERQTTAFTNLIAKNPELPFSLFTQSLCTHLRLNHASLNFQKDLFDISGELTRYDLSLIPFYQENESTLVIISILPNKFSESAHRLMQNILTPREQQIVEFVINGEKNLVIAYHLHISEGTVKRTLSNAYRKLGVSCRAELIKQYFNSTLG